MASISFDREAHRYDASRGYPPEVAAAIGQALFAQAGARPGLRVLEVGVGTGRIAIPLAHAGASVTGIDLSPKMLERLRATWAMQRAAHQTATWGSLTAEQGDITALPFTAREFDAVVGVHILHLVAQWRRALDEALRVLRPTGALLLGQDRKPGAMSSEIQQQWEANVRALGFDVSRPGAPFDEVTDELRARGMSVAVSVPVVWTVCRTPRSYLDALAARSSSATWAVPDDIFAASVTQLEAWARDRFTSRLDEVMEERAEFHVARAVWTGGATPA